MLGIGSINFRSPWTAVAAAGVACALYQLYQYIPSEETSPYDNLSCYKVGESPYCINAVSDLFAETVNGAIDRLTCCLPARELFHEVSMEGKNTLLFTEGAQGGVSCTGKTITPGPNELEKSALPSFILEGIVRLSLDTCKDLTNNMCSMGRANFVRAAISLEELVVQKHNEIASACANIFGPLLPVQTFSEYLNLWDSRCIR